MCRFGHFCLFEENTLRVLFAFGDVTVRFVLFAAGRVVGQNCSAGSERLTMSVAVQGASCCLAFAVGIASDVFFTFYF